MNKKDLLQQFQETIESLKDKVASIPENAFFESRGGKWSAAENVLHLSLSAHPVVTAMKLPKFFLRLLFGKPNRSGKSYEEVVAKYKQKLQEGAVATGPYVPKKTMLSKAELLQSFEKHHSNLLKQVSNWKEEELDNYLLPHPIIGKITVREMLHFTLYHIRHHSQTMSGLN